MSEDIVTSSHPLPELPSVEELSAELDGFSVTEVIGVGGMGAVFRAKQERLDREVAIKVLARGLGDESFAEHFKSEALAMARLIHTNIIAVFDFGESPSGWLYIVMEIVNGQTLHDLVQEGAIDTNAAVATILQTCSALAHAHEHGVIHRDVKSANILVNADGHAKIGDFGLAKLYSEGRSLGLGDSTFGTPDYSAPEVTDPNQAVDHRADIFSLGVLFFELLTGRLPEAGEFAVSMVTSLPPTFDELIRKATARDPGQRFQSVPAMRESVETVWEVFQQKYAPVLPPAPKATAGKGGVRNLVGAIAALALLGVGGAIFLQSKPADPKATSPDSSPSPTETSAQTDDGTMVAGSEKQTQIDPNLDADDIFQQIKKGANEEEDPDQSSSELAKNEADLMPDVTELREFPDDIEEPSPDRKDPTDDSKESMAKTDPLGGNGEAVLVMNEILEGFLPRFQSDVVSEFVESEKQLRGRYQTALTQHGKTMEGADRIGEEIERITRGKEIPLPDRDFQTDALSFFRRHYHAEIAAFKSRREAEADRLLFGLGRLVDRRIAQFEQDGKTSVANELRGLRKKLGEIVWSQVE